MHPKYKRMVNKMLADEKAGIRLPDRGWFLYILRCENDTFYTGVTKDLKRRLKMHNDGKASRYTRSRRPVKMIYSENCKTRAEALIRECKVKALTRQGKKLLISKGRPKKKKGRVRARTIQQDH